MMVKKTSTTKKTTAQKPIAKKTASKVKKTVATKKTTNNKNLIKNVGSLRIWTAVFLAINLILIVYIAFFKRDALWIEQLKTWGKWNFKQITKIYKHENFKEQQSMTLKQILAEMDGDSSSNLNIIKELDQETIADVMKNSHIEWKEDARLIIVEYSDFNCGYCHRQYDEKNIQRVIEKYPNDVAHIFKNHSSSPLAETVECAGEIWGSKAFYKFVDKAFEQQWWSEEIVANMAKEVWLNSTNLLKCISDGTVKTKLSNIVQEARSIFWITGTPGNVIIDRETGKYVVIAGAYPFETFDAEVQNLLNN